MISTNELGCVLSLVLLVSGVYLPQAQCQLILGEDTDDLVPDERNIYQFGQLNGGQNLNEDAYEVRNDPTDPYYESAQIQADQDKLIDQMANELLIAQQSSAKVFEPDQADNEISPDNGLLELLDQLNTQQQEKRRDHGYYYYDANSHLPATSLEPAEKNGQDLWVSKPVNDPEEFEAKLGQLTDVLNHNMANTADRQRLLMGLLNGSRDDNHELDLADDSKSTIDSVSSISQLEIDHLVNRLDKWLEEQAGNSQEERRDQRQQDDGEIRSTVSNGANDGVGRGSEYIDHPLALAGHQFVQGGAGEGRQLLGPDGTYENVQVIKTDAAIPSYCNPPNPCPLGYTAKDGCLEDFVNSASFSREYQAQQKCSCDNEHSLFNCAAPISQQQQQQTHQQSSKVDSVEDSSQSSIIDLGNKLDTLARTIQNRFGDLAIVQKMIGKQDQQKQEQDQLLVGNDGGNSNYLVRSARKLSALDMHHKVVLD